MGIIVEAGGWAHGTIHLLITHTSFIRLFFLLLCMFEYFHNKKFILSHLHKVLRVVKFIDRESRMVVLGEGGVGGRRSGELVFNGTEFQL